MSTCTTERFIGQGKVYVAPRASNGSINGAWTELGDTERLEVTIAQEFVDDYESCSGNRAIALHIPVQTDWSFAVDAKSFSKENLARAFYGTASTVTGTSVTNESVPVYAEGTICPLKHPDVSAVTVSATGGSPVLTVTDDYTIDAVNGTITFTTAGLAKLTGTPKAAEVDYTHASYDKVEANTTTISEYAFRFEGINLATKRAVIAKLHRVSLDMAETLSFISTTVNSFTMTGMMLPDPDAGSGESGYMTIVKEV